MELLVKENWGGWLGEERPTTSILAVRFSRGLAQAFVSPSLISIVRVMMFTTSLMMTEEQSNVRPESKFVATRPAVINVKFLSAMKFFSRKQCVMLHNIRLGYLFCMFTHTYFGSFLHNCEQIYTFYSILTKKELN